MEKRTAEVIMVLKGQHNLRDGLPEDTPQLGAYVQDLALYLSDNCLVQFSYFQNHQEVLDKVVHNAVLDYISSCENPRHFLWDYFEAKRTMQDNPHLHINYNDTQCWCSALCLVDVAEDGEYVNGFNKENTVKYLRSRPFQI